MRCNQLAPSSSNNSNALELRSCFDIEDKVEETDSNTNLLDVNTNIKGKDEADVS